MLTSSVGTPYMTNLLCDIQQGNTALHIAHRKGSFDVADILRRAGGDQLSTIQNKVIITYRPQNSLYI